MKTPNEKAKFCIDLNRSLIDNLISSGDLDITNLEEFDRIIEEENIKQKIEKNIMDKLGKHPTGEFLSIVVTPSTIGCSALLYDRIDDKFYDLNEKINW